VTPTVRITASGCHAPVVTGVLGLMLAGIAWRLGLAGIGDHDGQIHVGARRSGQITSWTTLAVVRVATLLTFLEAW
jgi:hypothetical protein